MPKGKGYGTKKKPMKKPMMAKKKPMMKKRKMKK